MGQFVSKAEFARLRGWNKSTATRAAQQGRIVLGADGLVDVDQSLRRLKLAEDPAKDAVRQRHAQERAARGVAGGDDSLRADPNDASYTSLQKSRALAEAHRAALLGLERAEREGTLADTSEVEKRAYSAAREARNAIFNLQYRLDPLLAGESDPAKRAVLWDAELRVVCDEIIKAEQWAQSTSPGSPGQEAG